jgi:hypothetical protein
MMELLSFAASDRELTPKEIRIKNICEGITGIMGNNFVIQNR